MFCQIASVAFHHLPVTRFCTANSTLPTAALSAAVPVTKSVCCGATLLFSGEPIVTVGFTMSPEGSEAPRLYTSTRSLFASAM